MHHIKTHGFEDAADLPQDLRDVLHRAEHQGADHDVHGLVLEVFHVLTRDDRDLLVGQVRVGVHAPAQVPEEVRVGVGADHGAAVRIELEVRPAAAADLQQAEGTVCAREGRHVPEKLPLVFVHFIIVRKRDIKGHPGEEPLVRSPQTRDLHQH